MKKILAIFWASIALVSCQDDVSFNNPGYQATINNELWKANIKSVTKSRSGSLLIKGTSPYYNLELTVESGVVGTYKLGTTNLANFANYYPINSVDTFYTTDLTTAPVSSVKILNGGSGYSTSSIVSTTGGSGTGLKVNIVANPNGVITEVQVNVAGKDYIPGDIITINGGNNDAQIEVVSVTKSSGEIIITENNGATISGTFKFLAFDSKTEDVISCRDGVFYKLPIN